jgi:hypothetical protein
VGKYCTSGQATEGNMVRFMRFVCWVAKVTQTQTHTHTYTIFNTYCILVFAIPECCNINNNIKLLTV